MGGAGFMHETNGYNDGRLRSSGTEISAGSLHFQCEYDFSGIVLYMHGTTLPHAEALSDSRNL